MNGLELAEKSLGSVKIVTSGAGAAALACLNLLVTLGAKRENIWVTDIEGVVFEGRESLMDRWKSVYAQKTDARTLAEVIPGADVFLGLSAGGVLKPEMVAGMADKPMILALANPTPEIMPDEARAVKPGAMICTGRSDFPNQVNNVLCFPYIFRGALDVAASEINEAMKAAAVRAIASLAREASSDVVSKAYGGETRLFGPESLIPSPFDPRLILRIAPAVARAAMESGVAKRPIADFAAYEDQLNRFVFRSGFVMKPVFAAARANPKRVIYADGEDERALRAAEVAMEEGIAVPILIGRPHVIDVRARRYGLTIKPGVDVEVINPEDDKRYRDYVSLYVELAGRKGVTLDRARTVVRTNSTVIGALAVHRGEADALLCGLEGRFHDHLRFIDRIIGLAPDAPDYSTLSLLISDRGAHFLADTYVTPEPDARSIADCAVLCARVIERFGITPKAALLSHSNFGSHDTPSAQKMRDALAIIRELDPKLEVDGEMMGDVALQPALRERMLPISDLTLKGEANLLLFPNLDAANIATQLIRALADALPVGPMLVGAAKPAHVLTPSVTARGVVNMTAVAVVEAAQASAGA